MDTNERLHALDALRAFALFLGIYFHASLSFFPGLDDWVVADTSSSLFVLITAGFSHLFRMALFFFIAGYFARLLLHRRGLAYFIRDRAKRIAVPLVMFLPIMLVVLGIIWQWGAQVMSVPVPVPPPLSIQTFPLTHLWFLYYLLWMYVIAIVGRHVFLHIIDRTGHIRSFAERFFVALMQRRVAPVLLSIPLALAALAVREWNPATGIPSPDKSLVPQLVPLVGFGTAFVAGWVCQRTAQTLALITAQTKSSLAISLVFFVLTWVCGPAVAKFGASTWWPLMQFAAAMCVGLTLWYFNLFLVGFALKHLSQPSAARRYAADSSYWLYIAHLPVVTGLQVVAAQMHWHWSIELTLIVVMSTALLLLSYQLLVRSTWLGAILNGKRLPEQKAAAPLAHAAQ